MRFRDRVVSAGPSTAIVVASVVALSSAAAFPTPATAARADDPSPVLHYEFDDDPGAGSSVTDSSGNGHDGTLINPATASSVPGSDGSALRLPGGTAATGAYVEIPSSALSAATDFTVSTTVNWDGDGGTWQRLFDIGSSEQKYLFVTPANGDGAMRAATTASGAQGESQNTAFAALPKESWHTVTVTVDGEMVTTYLDGVAVDSSSTFVSASQIVASNNLSGYIGRSFYPDPLFKGAVDDFQVFDEALSSDEVAALAPGDSASVVNVTQTSVAVRTKVGLAPSLPNRVRATFTDAFDRTVAATWDRVDESQYAREGTFTVAGTANGQTVSATVTVTPEDTMTVDLADDTGPFLGGAAGSLYGIYDDGIPTDNLLEGFGLKTNATKGQDGGQHPGSDALEVLGPLARTTDGDIYIRPTDYYRGFPYQWPGTTGEERLTDYFRVLDIQLSQVRTLLEKHPDLGDNIVIEPFNEPEGNMFGDGYWSYNGTSWLSNPTVYFAAWDRAYRRIKEVLPDTPVAGPNTSILYNEVYGFLEHTKTAGTVPDIMTWHELSNPAQVRTSIDRFRGWEDTLFGTASDIPINIDEYAFNYHTSVPGQMIQWISALEEKKADGMIAFWNLNGNLTDSAVQANRGNGQWWLYNAYSRMTGRTVKVTAPQPNVNYTLQGVSTFDADRRQARAIIGGQAGRARLNFVNVPSTLGSTVDVNVREIPWTGQLGDSAPPRNVAEFHAAVTGGTVSLAFGAAELPNLEESSAYEVILSPATSGGTMAVPAISWQQSLEAEDAAHSGSGYVRNGPQGSANNLGGYYTSGGYDVGGLQTGSDVTLSFDVDVPSTGSYDLALYTNTLNTAARVASTGPTNVFLSVDGAAEQEILLPLAYKNVVWDHTDTTVQLTAGPHTITVATRSIDGSKTTQGEATIDRLVLSLPNPHAKSHNYEAEFAQLDRATAEYEAPPPTTVSGPGGAAIAKGGTVTFWVYAKSAGMYDLTIDTATRFAGTVSINSVTVPTRAGVTTAALAGGVNKVEISGVGAWVDRLLVNKALDRPKVYEAEAAKLSGDSSVVELDRAHNGKAVQNIGGVPGNDNSMTFTVTAAKPGQHAVTVRFSNPEQVPATHYNPNPVARHADIWVNGELVAPKTMFVPTFHRNQFWDRTLYLRLDAGSNTIKFTAEEEPNWDGTTYASDVWGPPQWPGLILRSALAPIIDNISVAPASTATDEPVVSPVETRKPPKLNLGKPKFHRDKGIALLPVTVNTTAAIKLSGRGVKTLTYPKVRPGTVLVKVQATGSKLKQLRRTGKVSLTMRIRAVGTNGRAVTLGRKIVLLHRQHR